MMNDMDEASPKVGHGTPNCPARLQGPRANSVNMCSKETMRLFVLCNATDEE